MQSTVYLYGKEATELPSMREGLEARIAASKNLLDKLLDEPLATRDFARVHKVLAAISHNTLLLEGTV